METWGNRDRDMEVWRHRHGNMDMKNGDMETRTWRQETSNGKRKPRRFSLIHLPLVDRSCKRKFVVCPFVEEEINGSYPFANGLN
jgi:hypothetical protein